MSREDMRITPEEIELIKSTFRGNEKLLKLLRKIFLPEISANAPLGDQIDLWMTIPVEGTDRDKINIIARKQLIQHLEQSLVQLKVLAETEAKTLEEIREKVKKDSNK
jgi:hypothetical protein